MLRASNKLMVYAILTCRTLACSRLTGHQLSTSHHRFPLYPNAIILLRPVCTSGYDVITGDVVYVTGNARRLIGGEAHYFGDVSIFGEDSMIGCDNICKVAQRMSLHEA